ncbi:hypothetical protein QAD02_020495 [Eretmocerus hayati]|uniref:Uncharacterized protein n=1 Tax=Eretmocerus hayati TaxID=131215 RepID=A0ACC2PQS6_9HYME|nr:hypothetical protein QAD02_020495 [Eretmocerus hayati]
MSCYCVIEICEAKNNPAWDSPYVLVPLSFFKPEAVGHTVVYYPTPPYTYDLTAKVKDLVLRQAPPDKSWGEKECKMWNVAVTYEVGVQMLKSMKATKKTKKRKTTTNAEVKQIQPLAKVVRRIMNRSSQPEVISQAQAQGVVDQPMLVQPQHISQAQAQGVFAQPMLVQPQHISQAQAQGVVAQPMLVQPQGDTSQVLLDISNLESPNNESYPATSLRRDEVQANNDNDNSLSVDMMKQVLFSVPTQPCTQHQSQPQGSGSPTPVSTTGNHSIADMSIVMSDQEDGFNASNMSGSTEPGSLNLTPLNFREEIVTSSPQTPSAQGGDEYVLVRKKQLDDLENRLSHIIESKISNIVGKAVEQKTKPRFDEMHNKFREVLVLLAENHPNNDILTYDMFKNLHKEVVLPLHTYKDFTKFEALVQKNSKNVTTDMKKFITTTTSSTPDAQDNLKAVLGRFMDNEVLVLFTASKGNKLKSSSETKKPILKKTAFCSCLLDSFFAVYNTGGEQKLPEAIFYRALGTLINGARTFLGGDVVAALEAQLSVTNSASVNEDVENDDENSMDDS